MLGRISLCFLILAVPATALAGVPIARPGTVSSATDRTVHTTTVRAAEFSAMPRGSAPRCSNLQPPEALTTPNPLLAPAVGSGAKVTVSFVIGTDGRVHSPFILDGVASGDHTVLQTVRSWRYRPATCNGVPADVEAKIEFSRR